MYLISSLRGGNIPPEYTPLIYSKDVSSTMNPIDIQIAIMRAGTSQKAIADYLGVSPTAIGRVIKGTMRSAPIEKEIEKIVGKKFFPPKRKPGRAKTVWNGRVVCKRGASA